ncbi:uncharacterized protein [Spinacia oleracea]|uniref:DUF8039 domain-containing protein n=1 Tax=Spinacia oleracea TaxID=3562 RepID=A0ABM3RQ31_SPIOL|nr:uncharacterized protein LOC110776607 [Spinacia oleracea]
MTDLEWEAFVAQKTTLDAVAKRQKCSNYAKKKKHTHRLGPETYEEKRKRWKEKGLYPNGGNTRANDWWCSMHSLDKNGKYVIVNPETKEACDKLVEYQQACAEGKVSSVLNKDPLYMTLGPDPSGHPRGFGGVRVGLKKAYGEEYRKPTNSNFSASSTASDTASMREELKKEITEAILQQMGLQSLELPRRSPLDSSSQPILDLQPPNEGQEPTGFQPPARVQPSTGVQPMLEVQPMLGVQPMLELKEETPCELLHPGQSNGDKLYVVADANAQPQSDRPLVHFKQVPSGYYAVSPYNVHEDYLDWILPVPNNFLHTLADASGSYVLWPFAWVKFSDEIIKKLKAPPMKAKQKKPPTQASKDGQRSMELIAKGSSQGKSQNSKLKSSKGPVSHANLLVESNVFDSLSKPCKWLHSLVSELPDGNAIGVQMDMSLQFDDFSSDSHIGWSDPQSISGASFMNNRAESVDENECQKKRTSSMEIS